ncbi:PHD finger protein ALFIN-LIKE 1-like [Perca fluviatilis]|uniref:PHD finger protein ALFIN-LIKE 1-like n=1 Tax=Perca fluviatilis TaxID=8168 RepID=UPI0019626377|nr:PHD finger protein ALFIN-LIKE 1-like [Perca fluviatilis]
MAQERKMMALQILKESVFDETNHCSMCAQKEPIGSRQHVTKWIQCDRCKRWYHEKCLGMTKKKLRWARVNDWDCVFCC